MSYKIILGQPALKRFEWQLDILLTNLRSALGIDIPVVLVFTEDDMSVVRHFEGRYSNLEIHHYPDDRTYKNYPASTRPFLFYRYFLSDPSRSSYTYLQLDSDVVFREFPDIGCFGNLNTLYGSDCGGYLDYGYLSTRQRGEEIVDGIAQIMNIDRRIIEDTPGAGAQWIYSNPTADLWYKIWQDSEALWKYIETINSDIQRWTMEMTAQLYSFAAFGYQVKISSELDFCRPTDDIKMWGMVKIYHDAGVVGEGAAGLFYKGKYIDTAPFGEDLSWVRRDRCSWHYARAIEAVKNNV